MLGAERIAFTPALPEWKAKAITDVPMGLLAKIALQFDGARFGLSPNDWLTYKAPRTLPAEVCYFLAWPFDSDLMIGFVGGSFGWELSRAGEAAAVDFALGELEKLFGGEARRRFVRGRLTQWAADPFTLGGYSAAAPGRAAARIELARPVGERIFFAGEAVAGPYTATVGGAFMSGRAVARDLIRQGL